MERDRTGVAVSARQARRHHRLEREDDHDFAGRAHSENGGHRTRWSAEISACRCFRWSNRRRIRPSPSRKSAAFSSRRSRHSVPEIGVLLNLTPDHLDRHASFEEYAAREDAHVRKSARTRCRGAERGRSGSDAADAVASARLLVQPAEARGGGSVPARRSDYFPRGWLGDRCWRARSEIPLRGEHNVENVLAACAAAYLAGADPAAIAAGVKTFRGVEHRLEFVARDRRRRVLQRFESHECGRRAQSHRSISRAR